jgi:hypothetical protein
MSVARRPFIAICIPTLGMVHAFFMARMINLLAPMNRDIRYFYAIDMEVGEARNKLVADALACDGAAHTCSHVFFLDDDVLFHREALNQLLSRNRPIVSGLYYAKRLVPTPLVLHDDAHGTATTWTPGDLVECAGHGMGLTLIDANVFRRLRDETDLGLDPLGNPNWFTTVKDASLYTADGGVAVHNQTEDITFLKKARALGYVPAVDTSETAFGWHFDTKACTGYPKKQWAEFVERGTATWDTPHGPVTWGHSVPA